MCSLGLVLAACGFGYVYYFSCFWWKLFWFGIFSWCKTELLLILGSGWFGLCFLGFRYLVCLILIDWMPWVWCLLLCDLQLFDSLGGFGANCVGCSGWFGLSQCFYQFWSLGGFSRSGVVFLRFDYFGILVLVYGCLVWFGCFSVWLLLMVRWFLLAMMFSVFGLMWDGFLVIWDFGFSWLGFVEFVCLVFWYFFGLGLGFLAWWFGFGDLVFDACSVCVSVCCLWCYSVVGLGL